MIKKDQAVINALLYHTYPKQASDNDNATTTTKKCSWSVCFEFLFFDVWCRDDRFVGVSSHANVDVEPDEFVTPGIRGPEFSVGGYPRYNSNEIFQSQG